MFSHFPKYKYHPVHIMALVKSAEEEMALGEGWYESPAHFPVKEVTEEIKAFVIGKSTKGKRK